MSSLRRGRQMAAHGDAVEAMLRAAEEGDVEEVERLLDQDCGLLEARGDSRFLCNMTPLILAAHNGTIEVVRLLLDRGANVNARDVDGETAFYRAAACGHQEVAAVLVERGADIGASNHEGRTPLSAASEYGCLGLVRLLLHHLREAGLNANDGDQTALWWACKLGHTEVARALLRAGADHTIACDTNSVEYIEEEGPLITPLEIAHIYAHDDIVTLLQWWESEVERGYVVHRAKYHLEQHSILQPYFAAQAALASTLPPVATHLRPRVTVSQVPQVEIVPIAEDQEEASSASKRKEKQQGAEGPCEDEKDATLQYVMHHLSPELYIELMAGFHK